MQKSSDLIASSPDSITPIVTRAMRPLRSDSRQSKRPTIRLELQPRARNTISNDVSRKCSLAAVTHSQDSAVLGGTAEVAIHS